MKKTITKYKVKGMNTWGKTIHRTVNLETPVFKEKKHTFEGHEFTTTVEEQLDEYPINESIDFRDYDDTQEMTMVLDWKVVIPKVKKAELVKEKKTFDTALVALQKESGVGEETIANIAAVYYNMKDVIGHLPLKDQLHIVLRSTNVAAMAGTHAYKTIRDIWSEHGFGGDLEKEKEKKGRRLTRSEMLELKERNKDNDTLQTGLEIDQGTEND